MILPKRSKSLNLLNKREYPAFDDLIQSDSEIYEGSAMFLNAPKNRYNNVLPLASTRVHLNDLKNDYINANYHTCEKTDWIMTQAPVAASFRDFWKMVWDNNVSVIVMLTEFIENNVRKASKYWKSKQYSYQAYETLNNMDYHLTLNKEQTIQLICGKLTIFTLSYHNQKTNNETRKIYHIQYKNWRDHTGPASFDDIDNLINYMELFSNSSGNSEPAIVHCSAGVGRTGTFIACAIIKRLFLKRENINIPEIVNNLRRCRSGMVQTEEQYHFLYRYLEFLHKDN